jgi:hypothetical protein
MANKDRLETGHINPLITAKSIELLHHGFEIWPSLTLWHPTGHGRLSLDRATHSGHLVHGGHGRVPTAWTARRWNTGSAVQAAALTLLISGSCPSNSGLRATRQLNWPSR